YRRETPACRMRSAAKYPKAWGHSTGIRSAVARKQSSELGRDLAIAAFGRGGGHPASGNREPGSEGKRQKAEGRRQNAIRLHAVTQTPPQRESLVRAIGTFGLAAGIINITIGAGIFRLPANVAASLGAAAPTAYLVCAVAMGLIVFCIADAGRRVSLTGGPYAYVGTAFGSYAAFISGVLLWMLGTFATAAACTVFASSLGLLVPQFAGRSMEIGILIVSYLFWTVVNLRGVTLGVRLNSVAATPKLLPLLLVAIGGAFSINPENLRVTAMPAAGDVARTCLLLIFAFAGIECALVPSGEVRDTAR